MYDLGFEGLEDEELPLSCWEDWFWERLVAGIKTKVWLFPMVFYGFSWVFLGIWGGSCFCLRFWGFSHGFFLGFPVVLIANFR